MRWKLRTLRHQRDDGSYETVVCQTTADSDAGYSLMQCTTEGVPINWFIAFVGRSGDPGFKCLGGAPTKEEAGALCEAHLSKTQQELSVA